MTVESRFLDPLQALELLLKAIILSFGIARFLVGSIARPLDLCGKTACDESRCPVRRGKQGRPYQQHVDRRMHPGGTLSSASNSTTLLPASVPLLDQLARPSALGMLHLKSQLKMLRIELSRSCMPFMK